MENKGLSFTPIAEGITGLLNSVGSMIPSAVTDFINNEDSCSGACPPKNSCPPSCLLTISKSAYSGERIIVPFKIMNAHKTARVYRVGVRPLLDEQGQPAPNQPVLSTNHVNLQPGQSILVTMNVDLNNFTTGSEYSTEIVIREDKFNQNICFKLCVEGYCNVPTAKPWDEDSVYNQFRGWQSHFTCTTKKPTGDVPPRDQSTLSTAVTASALESTSKK